MSKDDRGTLLDDLTQTTPDGQRVIEVYETEVQDPDGNDITLTRTYDRAASLKEQVEHVAQDVCDQAVKMVTLANSATMEVGGSDEEPTVTVTLSVTRPGTPKPAAKAKK